MQSKVSPAQMLRVWCEAGFEGKPSAVSLRVWRQFSLTQLSAALAATMNETRNNQPPESRGRYVSLVLMSRRTQLARKAAA